MASWLETYRKDLQALRSSADSKLDVLLDLSREEQDLLLEPIRNGSAEAGEVHTLGERFWDRFRKEIVDSTKREVEAILKLRPLFERLARASEQEWEAFAHLYHDIGWSSGERSFRRLLNLSSLGGP